MPLYRQCLKKKTIPICFTLSAIGGNFLFLVEIVTRLQKEYHPIVYKFVFRTSLHRASLLQDAVAKSQMKSECIYEIIDFPKYQ